MTTATGRKEKHETTKVAERERKMHHHCALQSTELQTYGAAQVPPLTQSHDTSQKVKIHIIVVLWGVGVVLSRFNTPTLPQICVD